jgi:quinol monooxygenase YgiN
MVPVSPLGSEKNEPGCLMFNIVRDNADPNVLHLFEVYQDDEAVEAHKKAPHFLKWLETTKDWLAAPLEVARYDRVSARRSLEEAPGSLTACTRPERAGPSRTRRVNARVAPDR